MTTEQEQEYPWLSREMTVTGAYGVHTRPAYLIVKTAQRFDAEVTFSAQYCFRVDGQIVKRGDCWHEEVNAREILPMMCQEIFQGTVVRLRARGHDATEALDALEQLFCSDDFNRED